MTQAFNLPALQDALNHAVNMVEYYGKAEEKRAQNEAMKAAGLKPLHTDTSFRWDLEQRDRFARQAEALRAVIEHVGGSVRKAA